MWLGEGGGKGFQIICAKIYQFCWPSSGASVGISNVKMGENELQRAKQT